MLDSPMETLFSQLAVKCVIPARELENKLTGNAIKLFYLLSHLSSEVGELSEAVIRHWVYGQDTSLRQDIIEELGDIEIILENLRLLCGIDRLTVLNAATQKLNARFPNGKFTSFDAATRRDKAQGDSQ